MKVTDKDYYLDDNLKENLDFCIKRQKKNFDHVFIIDGNEGYGKSSFSLAVGNYLAYSTGKPFSLDNVFFDVDKMMEFAVKTEEQVIIWDEAALMGLSKEWQNKLQIKLTKLLMVARKKRHFWIFNIPSIAELNSYVAVRRSIALLHVYSPDHITRGAFVFLNKRIKNKAYIEMKKSKREYYGKYNFHGKFTDTSWLIDNKAYEAKKDAAILSVLDTETVNSVSAKLIKLQYGVTTLERYSLDELAPIFGVDKRTLYNWKNLSSKYPHILGESGKN